MYQLDLAKQRKYSFNVINIFYQHNRKFSRRTDLRLISTATQTFKYLILHFNN